MTPPAAAERRGALDHSSGELDMETRSTPRHRVAESAHIDAAPAAVYGILADYRNGHPRILPPAFRDLQVERGGTGAGTVIRFQMRVLGQTRSVRGTVTEPAPGRVLVESYPESDTVTTFTVDPDAGGAGAVVTIETTLPGRSGLLGAVERRVVSTILRRIYAQELALLGAVAGAARPSSA
jgi:hypothetical protein